MQVSDLIDVLQKVRQVAGDIPVVVHHLEDDITTELRTIAVHIDPAAGGDSGRVELEHATPPPPAPAPAPAGPAVDTAAGDSSDAG